MRPDEESNRNEQTKAVGMTEENAIEAVGQAGHAASEEPAEGSVASGEDADSTDSGQSEGVAETSDDTVRGASAGGQAEG